MALTDEIKIFSSILLAHIQFVQHKPHMYCAGIELDSFSLEDVQKSRDLRDGHYRYREFFQYRFAHRKSHVERDGRKYEPSH